MANALKEIEHAQRLCDRGDITIGEYFELVEKWEDAEPVKHGRWKPFDLTWGRSVYACTSCGEAFEEPTEDGKPIYDYCPNCGAKMDEVE